ncbi:MAG: thiamine pyrophosphate-binding protein [Rheinheimera sp.]|nr:thiamine pyrophosphate-binding protein [Rheinheimera sp.]
MILADLLQRQLSDNGIYDLYTIPGDFILPWLGALESGQRQQAKPLRLIQLSHEPSAVYAADAAARWRNAPSAVMLTYGAGALNAVNAIAQAYMEFVPLLVFAGYPSQQEVASGLLLHHQVSDLDAQRRILTEVTCGQCRLDDPPQRQFSSLLR